MLSLLTPDGNNGFAIEYGKEKELKLISTKGFEIAKNKRMIICTLLRDAANKINEIRKRSESIGKMFADYRILVVENDSSDGTRKKLLKWKKENPRVIILGCGVDQNVCRLRSASSKTDGHGVDRKRIQKMVTLRNIYLDFIKNSSVLRNFDYTTVWDLDIVGSVYLDGVANTIAQFEKISSANAICGYGMYRWGFLKLYYDTYAHIDFGDKFHIDLKTLHDLKKGIGISKYKRGHPLIPVVSCFSGFTIYKTSSLLNDNVRYDMSHPDKNLECEHVRLNRKLGEFNSPTQPSVYLNPSMIHFVLLND